MKIIELKNIILSEDEEYYFAKVFIVNAGNVSKVFQKHLRIKKSKLFQALTYLMICINGENYFHKHNLERSWNII